MNQKAGSNTALFLMELIVVIGFFSLVSVICVRLFAAARVTGDASVNINQAIRAEESLAEVWTAKEADLAETAACFPGARLETGDSPADGVLTLYYDADWQSISDEGGAAFRVTLTGTAADAADLYGEGAQGAAAAAGIEAVDLTNGSRIHMLETDHYIGGAG